MSWGVVACRTRLLDYRRPLQHGHHQLQPAPHALSGRVYAAGGGRGDCSIDSTVEAVIARLHAYGIAAVTAVTSAWYWGRVRLFLIVAHHGWAAAVRDSRGAEMDRLGWIPD